MEGPRSKRNERLISEGGERKEKNDKKKKQTEGLGIVQLSSESYQLRVKDNGN